jgi:hypothetical protein
MFRSIILTVLSLSIISASAQVMTREDSLQANLDARDANTYISGYGELKYEYDFVDETAHTNLTRSVLFVGHRFNNKISFFSELELEDAKIEGGEPGGEISLEQFYLRFNINKDLYLVGGLFTPRLGIINENHLPTTYNGNDRPYVETFVIPATWREIGISIYGALPSINGLNYSFGIVNGLNSAGFENGNGIRGGRFEGSNASASNLAVTGSLLYHMKNWRFQASGYFGGSAGLNGRDADSLQLESGMFGTPVSLTEADIQYNGKLISFRALYAIGMIPDAQSINAAYANNVPESFSGAYAEAGINLLYLFNKETKKNLTLFARYETMDLDQKIAENGIENDVNEKQYIVTGLTFKPIHGVAIKADYVYRKTGEQNPALILNPSPQAPAFSSTNGFFNLGFGLSF